jgi:hypothetical protein
MQIHESFVQQVDCMMRLKGKTGRQKVTVEHVHVHSGGKPLSER